jgi:hypothetical protein
VMSCASAVVDSASDAPSARPISFNDVMMGPRGDRYGECPAGRRGRRYQPLSADFAAKSSAILRPEQGNGRGGTV